MLNAVIRFALHYRFVIVALSLIVLVYGAYTATTLPIDVFPDLDRPRVVIMTEVPGEAAEEVESLVTVPLKLDGLPFGPALAARITPAPDTPAQDSVRSWRLTASGCQSATFSARRLLSVRGFHK